MHWYYGSSAEWEGFMTAVLMLLLWAGLTVAATVIVVWLHETHHRP